MAKASIALTELAEKGPDTDLVRDMLHFAAQKLMEMDVEALCGAQYGERAVPRENSRNGYRDIALGDAYRRNRLAHTQAAQGQLFSRLSRAAANGLSPPR